MWIVTNKSFLSIVQDKQNPDYFVVRARISGDLENFFEGFRINVIETEDSDYRFRVFIHKAIVKSQMMKVINSIDYTNFKDSVKNPERKSWYTRIWYVMFDVQEKLYGQQAWWKSYKNGKNFQTANKRISKKQVQ